LPDEVQGMLERGELTAGHARTLITSEDPLALARRIVDSGLSVREAEALHQKGAEARRPQPAGEKRAQSKDADTLALEKQLSDALGLSVTLEHKDRGGKLEIRYKTLEQLDGICSRLLPH
jgi:ParB family chromosome partitioning protein